MNKGLSSVEHQYKNASNNEVSLCPLPEGDWLQLNSSETVTPGSYVPPSPLCVEGRVKWREEAPQGSGGLDILWYLSGRAFLDVFQCYVTNTWEAWGTCHVSAAENYCTAVTLRRTHSSWSLCAVTLAKFHKEYLRGPLKASLSILLRPAELEANVALVLFTTSKRKVTNSKAAQISLS